MRETPTAVEPVVNGISREEAVQAEMSTSDNPASSSLHPQSEKTFVHCTTLPVAEPAIMSASAEHSQPLPSLSHLSEPAAMLKEMKAKHADGPSAAEAVFAGPAREEPQASLQTVQSAEGGSKLTEAGQLADSQSIEKPLMSADLTVSFIRVRTPLLNCSGTVYVSPLHACHALDVHAHLSIDCLLHL